MAVLTLEETKQYLRVDSSDEDSFISGLIETGENLCADVARMDAAELESHLPMVRIAVLYLSAILADCRTAFGGLSESEKAAAAEALVGKNAMSGFLALMNAAPADIEKVSSAIANCDGKSAEMAATMQDNLAGQITILKSQLEELAISFGEILMPAIRQIVTWVQGFVDKLNGMDEGTKNTIVTIGLLAAAIGPVLMATAVD